MCNCKEVRLEVFTNAVETHKTCIAGKNLDHEPKNMNGAVKVNKAVVFN